MCSLEIGFFFFWFGKDELVSIERCYEGWDVWNVGFDCFGGVGEFDK